jgi:hypothetical protein
MKRNHLSKFLLNSIKLLLTNRKVLSVTLLGTLQRQVLPENAYRKPPVLLNIVLKAGEDMKLYTIEKIAGEQRGN